MPTINRKGRQIPKPKVKHRNGSRSLESNYDLYNSWTWRKFNKGFSKRNPWCEECKKKGKWTPGQQTDHRIRIVDGGSIYDERNLQRICKICHAKKSGREAHKIILPWRLNEDGDKIPM